MSLADRWNRCPKHVQLLLILMTTVVVGWIRFQGISLEGDPAAYAKLAFLDAQDLPPWAEWTFTQRQGLLAPVSFIVSILGPQLWAFVIWPWTCLVILSLVIWWKAKGSLQFYLLAILLLGPWPSAYGLQLFPDFPMLTFSILALLLLPHLRDPEVHHNDWVWGIAFTLSLAIAGLCKLTMLYLLPGIAGLAVYDLLRRQHVVFWTTAFVTAVSLLGLTFLIDDWNIIHRINQMETDHNSSPFSYDWNKPLAIVLRLIQEPFVMFFGNPGVGILLFPAVAGMFSNHKYAKPASAFLIYLLVIHWVGTTSLQKYSPIPADPRMWILLSGPLLLLATIGLLSIRQQVNRVEKWVWVAIMLILGLIGLTTSLTGIVFPFLVGLTFFPILRLRAWIVTGFGLLLVLWMGYHIYKRDSQYYQATEIRLLRASVPEGSILYVDSVLAFSDYLYDAEGVAPCTTWPDSIPQQTLGKPQFFLWNGIRIWNVNLYETRISLPAYLEEIRTSWEVIGDTSNPALRLYQLPMSDL